MLHHLDVEQVLHLVEFGNGLAVHDDADAAGHAPRLDERLQQIEAAQLDGGNGRLQPGAQDARVRARAHEGIDEAALQPVACDGERVAEGAVDHLDLGAAGVLRHHRHREPADLPVAQETQARQLAAAHGSREEVGGSAVAGHVALKHRGVSWMSQCNVG
ncbi:hypothetical protein D9M72_404530 [compost metagenome]